MNFKSDLAGRSVLITGAGGCIGAWVVKILAELGATPVVYDLVYNRDRMNLIMEDAESIDWTTGDIADFDRLITVIRAHEISAIIHLAALQVPFCKADPVGSAKVNVIGSASILEAARQCGIDRLSYASSIAAPAMGENDALATLYGAHKVCGEQMAAVYWQDWQVPSVGIRPAIVYGPGRDRGMSAAPTVAMLAAFAGERYRVPFTGPVSFIYAEDIAARFVAAVSKPINGAFVFDANGTPETVDDVLGFIQCEIPEAGVGCDGDPLPFPAEGDSGALEEFLGLDPCRSMQTGVKATLEVFKNAKSRIDIAELARDTIRRNS